MKNIKYLQITPHNDRITVEYAIEMGKVNYQGGLAFPLDCSLKEIFYYTNKTIICHFKKLTKLKNKTICE